MELLCMELLCMEYAWNYNLQLKTDIVEKRIFILEWFRYKIMIKPNKFLNTLFPTNNIKYHDTLFLTNNITYHIPWNFVCEI